MSGGDAPPPLMNLTKPSELRALLEANGIRLTKRMGQHYLTDRNNLMRVVNAAALTPEDCVFEIGPGVGTLTRELATRTAKVVSVELDRGIVPILRQCVAEFPNVTVIEADALKLDLPTFLPEQWGAHFGAGGIARGKVVANIPYNITSPLLAQLLDAKQLFSSLTLMVQKEVAERLAAPPDSPNYGSFSVFAQYHAVTTIAGIVPRNAFFPPPKVDSAVIHLIPRAAPPVNVPSDAAFFAISRAAFGQRRKTLLNALANAESLPFDKSQIQIALDLAGIDGNRRGETLTMAELAAVSRAVFRKK